MTMMYTRVPSGIKERASLFFSSLAHSGSGSKSAGAGGNANPVYNLLPDILSALCREEGLREEQFRIIMGELLQYVKVGGLKLI